MSRGLGSVERSIIDTLQRGDQRAAEIAAAIGDVLLPSVRRALSSLARKGIAERDGHHWRLTTAHRTRAAKLIRKDAKAALRRMVKQGIRVHAIVCDPPYAIELRGERWSKSDVAFDVELWKLCHRLLLPGGHLLAFGHAKTYHRLAVAIEDAGFEIRDMLGWVYSQGIPKRSHSLKPAIEPIVMARKPISEKTLAKNVRRHGTGIMQIDAARIGDAGGVGKIVRVGKLQSPGRWGTRRVLEYDKTKRGRHPANVLHDGSAAVRDAIPTSSVFYCAKPSKQDRGPGNNHATVKPTELMAYLVRLVTPPGGLVLDPFMGSGSTGKAALASGFNFLGVEWEPGAFAVASGRIDGAAAGS